MYTNGPITLFWTYDWSDISSPCVLSCVLLHQHSASYCMFVRILHGQSCESIHISNNQSIDRNKKHICQVFVFSTCTGVMLTSRTVSFQSDSIFNFYNRILWLLFLWYFNKDFLLDFTVFACLNIKYFSIIVLIYDKILYTYLYKKKILQTMPTLQIKYRNKTSTWLYMYCFQLSTFSVSSFQFLHLKKHVVNNDVLNFGTTKWHCTFPFTISYSSLHLCI